MKRLLVVMLLLSGCDDSPHHPVPPPPPPTASFDLHSYTDPADHDWTNVNLSAHIHASTPEGVHRELIRMLDAQLSKPEKVEAEK